MWAVVVLAMLLLIFLLALWKWHIVAVKTIIGSYDLVIGIVARLPLVGKRVSKPPVEEGRVHLAESQLARLSSRGKVMVLAGLSLVRFAAIAVRLYLVSLVLGLNIPLLKLMFCVPVVHLSAVLSVMPGNLGIADLSWLGTLSLAGVDGATAMLFTVGRRALVMVIMLVLVLLTCLFDIWRGVRCWNAKPRLSLGGRRSAGADSSSCTELIQGQ